MRIYYLNELNAVDQMQIDIDADLDLGVPGRILDLFAAIGHVPSGFSCQRTGPGLTIALRPGALGEPRQSVLLAKLTRICGVRTVRLGAVRAAT